MITALINEFNNLFALYFKSIGIIQRDYENNEDNLKSSIQEIVENIKASKESIENLINQLDAPKDVENEPVVDLEKYEKYLRDYLAFIDHRFDFQWN